MPSESDTKPEEALTLLRQCEMLEGFPPKQLEQLVLFMDLRSGSQGDVLFFEGENADALFIVGTGRLEMLVNDKEEQARLVGWLGPSESFGEMSLLLGGKRMVTVRAVNPVTIFELSKDSFHQLRLQYPETCLTLTMAIIKRFGHLVADNQAFFKKVLLSQLERV